MVERYALWTVDRVNTIISGRESPGEVRSMVARTVSFQLEQQTRFYRLLASVIDNVAKGKHY